MPAIYHIDDSSPFDLVPDQSTQTERGALALSDDRPNTASRREEFVARRASVTAAGLRPWEAIDHQGGVGSARGLAKRTTLEPNHTQSVTLGVIGA